MDIRDGAIVHPFSIPHVLSRVEGGWNLSQHLGPQAGKHLGQGASPRWTNHNQVFQNAMVALLSECIYIFLRLETSASLTGGVVGF